MWIFIPDGLEMKLYLTTNYGNTRQLSGPLELAKIVEGKEKN